MKRSPRFDRRRVVAADWSGPMAALTLAVFTVFQRKMIVVFRKNAA